MVLEGVALGLLGLVGFAGGIYALRYAHNPQKWGLGTLVLGVALVAVLVVVAMSPWV